MSKKACQPKPNKSKSKQKTKYKHRMQTIIFQNVTQQSFSPEKASSSETSETDPAIIENMKKKLSVIQPPNSIEKPETKPNQNQNETTSSSQNQTQTNDSDPLNSSTNETKKQ